MPLDPDFRLVRKSDAANIFGVCLKTIDNYIDSGLLPQPVAFGSRDYWHPDDFEQFIAQTFKRRNASKHTDIEAGAPPAAPSEQGQPCARGAGQNRRSPPPGKSHPTMRALARQQVLLDHLNRDDRTGDPSTPSQA